MSNVLNEMLRFQTDRLLHKQKFDLKVASMNILEELLEAHGVHDNDDRILSDLLYHSLLSSVDIVKSNLIKDKDIKFVEPTDESMVDAFCDIQNYAFSEPLKLGYDPIKCLDETQLEINSRRGEIVNGKFTKFKDEESIKLWYKANYSKAKLGD